MRQISLLFILLFTQLSYAQIFDKQLNLPESNLKLIKTGALLGLEQGKYLNFNFGVERQWQEIKLFKPKTQALNLQFDYNFTQKVLGIQSGYWWKAGRLNLTYGSRISFHTDFDRTRFGISPNVGYKLLQAHFQIGVHLLTPNEFFQNTNVFYVSGRWVFINDRDFDRKKGEKKEPLFKKKK